MPQITGTNSNDLLYGTAGDDEFLLGLGIDTAYGGDGNDSIYARDTSMLSSDIDGNDIVYGENGNDSVWGGDGNDILDGGQGNDILYGENGNDSIAGGIGDDTLSGDSSNDTLDGGDGKDRIYTGDGDDVVYGGAGDDEINGYLTGEHTYVFWSSSGSQQLNGDDGNDVILGGTGVDQIWGGSGNDELYGLGSADTIDGGSGNDYLDSGDGNDSLVGGDGQDVLQSGSGDDTLIGGNGNDSLYGGDGNDTLDGGAGDDTLSGGDGNDYYVIESKSIYVYDSGGTDSALVTANFVKIPSSIESVSFSTGIQTLPYWIDALLPDDASGQHYASLLGQNKTFNFTFPAALPSYDTTSEHSNGFLAFNDQQKTFARQTLAYIASIIDGTFVETTNASALNTITFANNTQTDSSGYAYHPSGSFGGNDLFLNKGGDSDNLAPADNTYAALTLIHELGHSLGLKHPFRNSDSTGDVADPPYLSGSEDDSLWTVMSYTSHPEQYHPAYSPLDIATLQYLYGPSTASKAGNDTYPVSRADANFIWDGSGTDTLDASIQSQPVTLYLEPGRWGYVGSKASKITSAGQVTVNFGSVIENLVGGSGSDTLFGNDIDNSISGGDGNDTLQGGAGDDTVEGGAGINTTLYAGSLSSFLLSSHSGVSWTAKDNSGAEGTDTLTHIANLTFSDGTVKVAADLTSSTPDGTATHSLAEFTDAMGQRLEKFYLAYYGRAADYGGLVYWKDTLATAMGGNERQMVGSFGNAEQAEFVNLYGTSNDNAAFLNAVYQNLFSHAPDTGGRDYWLGIISNSVNNDGIPLQTARANAVIYIVDGAQGSDITAINNKIANMTTISQQIATYDQSNTYGDPNATTALTVVRNWTQAQTATAAIPPASVVQAVTEKAIATAAVGGNEVQTSASYTLPNGFANLKLAGSAALTGAGNASDNLIYGNCAESTLLGGAGNDCFVVTVLTGKPDRVTDFAAEDLIAVDTTGFSALQSGVQTVQSYGHQTGTTATLVYDQTTGALYYDADGTGSQPPQTILTLTGTPALNLGSVWGI